jgi:hypothetical protein
MRVIGGRLQEAVDSFDSTKINDRAYVSKFIDIIVAPAVATLGSYPVNPADITWEGEYFHVVTPFNMKLYPEAQTATAVV